MPRFALALAAVVAPLLFATNAHAALGVCDASPADNIEVEATAGTPGPTSYNTLGAAFAAINAGTHQGSIAIEVCGSPTEAASAVLNASGVGSAAYTAISVKPVGGAARAITGTLAAPLIDLNGADNVTIDGVQTGGNTLALVNTSTAVTAGTSTIRFIGGATGNTVTRTSVQGSSLVPLATAGGTIVFGTDTVAATGNDSNTVSFCDIGPAGTNLPIKAIFGLGTTTTLGNYNSGVVIDHNNVFDFFGTGAASVSGIHVLGGNDAWTISNNRLYQTAPRVFTATARYAAMTLSSTTTGGAFSVTGNTIGFGAANGTGTTTISGVANTFRGIDATTTNITTPTIYQNNVVSGINQTTSAGGTTTSSPFIGITLGSSDGRYNAIGNQIGSLDGSSTIVVNSSTATSSLIYCIFDFSFQGNTIANNTIGAITIQGTGAVTGFRGIYWNTGTGLDETVTNNTIGGSGAGGIVDSQVGANSLYGINGVSAAGIVTGNVISNMTGNAASAAVNMSGILVSGSTRPNTISRNTVQSLSNNAGTIAGAIYAIDMTLPVAANVVERNLVRSISATSTANGYQIIGIIARTQGTATYKNNMISLGLDALGNSITSPFSITGIRDSAGTTSANSYYFNSVYIGGTGVLAGTGASNSLAMNSDVVTNVRNFQNNIFWNARSNAVPGGLAHIAIRVGGTAPSPAGLTSNYNDLLATGTDGFVGLFNSVLDLTLSDWMIATGGDVNSLALDPLFVSTTNLHVPGASPMFAAGTPIAGVTDDFDGDVRPATPTIGADEPPPPVGVVSISPLSHDFGNQAIGTTSAASTITLSNTGAASFNVTAVTAAAAPFAQSGGTCTAVPFTLAAGASCTFDYTFSPTVAGAANQAFTVTASAGGDAGFALSGTGTANAPTIAKSFTPASVATATNSTATVTLTNPNAAAITLTANLVDTLPAGLVASAASTTCGGTASFTAGSLTLATGATIPASGSCTLTGTVQAATAGSYVNTIAAGDLQTNAGNNAAAATATLTVTAAGGLVCSPPINHAIATDIDGSYFGWVSGTVSDNTFAGYNFNPYGSGGNLAFFWGSGNAGVATTATTGHDWLVLHTGDTVGASSTFSNATGAATNWDATSDGYLGFRFGCTAGTCYGYAHMTSTGPTGFPATLVDYCYDSGGATVTIPTPPPAPPTVAKSFTPASVAVNTNSTATITLTNPNASVLTLTANLVDTLPAGLVASAAATTCGGTASFTAGSLTLATGATIPASGSCTLTGTVQSAAAGSYVNTIPAGAVQTAAGNNAAAATATLTVTAAGVPVAAITPTSLTFSVQAGDNTTGPLNIANTGTATLNWSLTEAAAIPKPSSHVSNPKAAPSPEQFSREGTASGVQSPSRPNPTPKAVAIDEGFDDITTLPGAGWLQINHSNPLGVTNWSQGTGVGAGGPFDAFDGAATAFISANYNNSGDGTLSNWLVTPSVTFNAGSSVSFYTRNPSATYPDRLEVRLCTTGACTNVGTSETDVGDFTTLLLSVNPNLVAAADPTGVNGYPTSWAQFNITSGLPSSGTGRIAFRYFVTDAGPTGVNSNYIGIDRVVVDNGGGGGGGCGSPSNIPWLSESLTSGAVAAGNADVSNITVDASSLTEGTYNAHICVATDDPAHALVDVPVTVTVTPPPFVPCSAGSDEIFCDGFEDAVVGTCTPTQLFTDPGFEIGAGSNGAWTSFDSQFTVSYCDASCDNTATIVPHAGSWFVWFGGANVANTATLTQAVTFPSGQARWLNYWLIDQIAGDPTATLTVKIDGAQVLNIVGGTTSQTYAAQTFPIPAVYLDGASHSVSFNWSAGSPAAQIGGAMIDDVTLDCSAQPTRPASNPSHVTAAFHRGIH